MKKMKKKKQIFKLIYVLSLAEYESVLSLAECDDVYKLIRFWASLMLKRGLLEEYGGNDRFAIIDREVYVGLPSWDIISHVKDGKVVLYIPIALTKNLEDENDFSVEIGEVDARVDGKMAKFQGGEIWDVEHDIGFEELEG